MGREGHVGGSVAGASRPLASRVGRSVGGPT